MKKVLSALCLGFSVSSVLALPDYEPFADASGSGGTTYTAGAAIQGQTDAQGNSWFQAGGGTTSTLAFTIASGSLTEPGLAPSSGNSLNMTPQPNIAARFAIGTTFGASTTVYYSFLLKVPDIGSTLGTGGGFIAGFNNTATGSQTGSPTVLGTRVLIRNVGAGAGFNLGLSKASSTASDFTFGGSPTTFTTSDTIFIVGSYTVGTIGAVDDSSQLWINPNSVDFGAGSAPAATLTATSGADMVASGTVAIGSFLFYGRPNNLAPNSMTVDELRIGTSWADVTPTTIPEPGFAALAGLGVFGMISAYRLRKR